MWCQIPHALITHFCIVEPKDYLQCHLAASPAHAVLTRADATVDEIAYYQQLLASAAKRFGRFSQIANIFDGKLFSKSAIGLDRVAKSKRSYQNYLGAGYVKAIASLEGCS